MSGQLYKLIYRAFFLISFILLLLAILDRILIMFGYTLTFITLGPAKLLQYAGIFAIFTILLLLRQIRDQQKK